MFVLTPRKEVWLNALKNSARNCVLETLRDFGVFDRCKIPVVEAGTIYDPSSRVTEMSDR